MSYSPPFVTIISPCCLGGQRFHLGQRKCKAPETSDTLRQKRGRLEIQLEIRPYGPLRPGDWALQIPPIYRNDFLDILTMAENARLPAILHGPYQCGKTSLLYAFSEHLVSRGYNVFFLDLDDAIQLEGFCKEKFYQEVSLQVFRERMDEGQFRSHFEHACGSKKNPFFLVDEMQQILASNTVERAVRRFLKFLDRNGVPWIGVGASELRGLAWKNMPLDGAGHRGLGAPFNRAQFNLMPGFNYKETAILFKKYEEARAVQIPDIIKRAIETEAAGHPSTFMTPLKME
jgi:AAA domain